MEEDRAAGCLLRGHRAAGDRAGLAPFGEPLEEAAGGPGVDVPDALPCGCAVEELDVLAEVQPVLVRESDAESGMRNGAGMGSASRGGERREARRRNASSRAVVSAAVSPGRSTVKEQTSSSPAARQGPAKAVGVSAEGPALSVRPASPATSASWRSRMPRAASAKAAA